MGVSLEQKEHDSELISDEAGEKKVFHGVLPAFFPHGTAFLRTLQKMAETEGEPFHGVDAISGLPLDDLKPNTPHIAPDDGFPLPHGFGDCEPKSFLEGFLNHHSGRPLEGVDGPMGIRG